MSLLSALHHHTSVNLARLIPWGLLALMTGMFWIGDRSNYHKIYYALVIIPTLVALILNPRKIIKCGKNGIFLCALAFCGYTMLSILWSTTDDPSLSLLKQPLYVLLAFYAFTLVAQQEEKLLERILQLSLSIATLSALISLAYFLYSGTESRFPGYGALYNPLLTSHVYGIFAAIALAYLFSNKNKTWIWLSFFSILTTLLVLTGSRTPLLALGSALLWLTIATFNGRALIMLVCCLSAGLILFLLYPESFTSRGLSYRPEIWHQAWQQIAEHPLFGHGYGHPLLIKIEGFDYAFTDPHNLLLAVLFSGGLVGLGIWLLLYGVVMRFAWRNRNDIFILAASTALVFGFIAGLTEGKAFISRPKEHWFLIWIPLSLLAAACMRKKEEST